MTAEQLEASRAERMRQNGHGALTLEDARTWLEETGLCPFAPRKQFSTFTAPSFVEAVAGHRNQNPDAKHVALAEDLLVRLERDDVAVRLNMLGQPGEQADYVVASWVLPYVYALRGDRDWRRNPQLTGSRQVSPLAVEAYKLLEKGDATISNLKHALGREVSEAAVVRAVTELWQQLRIVPVIKAPGEPVYWQLLRVRFQKAIAEGASTSQVTAISVLASIYLQAVIAASMEEVELFLSPLTARSKIREVLRGLLATRQVHTIQLGHAPHFYVAGTLPEFASPATIYASAAMASSSYFTHSYDHHDHYDRYGHFERNEHVERTPEPPSPPPPAPAAERHEHHEATNGKSASNGKSTAARSHFNRPASRPRDRKPAQSSSSSRPARRPASEARKPASRQTATRTGSAKTGTRWASGAKTEHGKRNGVHKTSGAGSHARSQSNSARVTRSSGSASASHDRSARADRPASGKAVPRDRSASRSTWTKHSSHSGKSTSTSKAVSRTSGSTRKSGKTDSRSRKPVLTAGAKAGNSRRYGFTAPAKPGTKKRG